MIKNIKNKSNNQNKRKKGTTYQEAKYKQQEDDQHLYNIQLLIPEQSPGIYINPKCHTE